MVIGRGHVLAKKWGGHGRPCHPYDAALGMISLEAV